MTGALKAKKKQAGEMLGSLCPKDLVDCSQGFEFHPVDKESLLGDLQKASEQLGANLGSFTPAVLCRMD